VNLNMFNLGCKWPSAAVASLLLMGAVARAQVTQHKMLPEKGIVYSGEQIASLRPGPRLMWKQTSPTVQGPDGPVLYQLIFNASGVPGAVPVFDTNPRHLANSPIAISSGNIVIGGGSALTINGSSGLITFAPGQTFPASGFPNLAGEVTGPATATVVSNAVAADAANAIVRRDSLGNFSAAAITLDTSLDIPMTTSPSAGIISQAGNPVLHFFGSFTNTFLGSSAGNFTTTGGTNTGLGAYTLRSNTTGNENTAVGFTALTGNTSGTDNSALGWGALRANTSGTRNSAFGFDALASNTTAGNNAAFGYFALSANTTGTNNSAFGYLALSQGSVSSNNAAFGTSALAGNSNGGGNSAFGFNALKAASNSFYSSAFGYNALSSLTTGQFDVAIGRDALLNFGSTGGSGDNNTAIGAFAGNQLLSGSNNIYIGNVSGIGTESNTIRIGSGAGATFISGIAGATSAGGFAVFIDGNGHLGTATSSRRYKQDIADLGAESDVLMKLRPVAFYYKPELDDTHTRQYGLVAEEVAQIAPGLVIFDKDGQPQTVRYHFVNAMLLNEVQKQRRMIEAQQKQNDTEQQEIDRLNAALENQQTAQHAEMVSLREEIKTLRDLLQKSGASSLSQLAGNKR